MQVALLDQALLAGIGNIQATEGHREIKETREVRDGETRSDVRIESNGRTTTRRE